VSDCDSQRADPPACMFYRCRMDHGSGRRMDRLTMVAAAMQFSASSDMPAKL